MKKGFVVPVQEKIAYGMGDFAINIGYGAIGFYFVFFLTDVAGLPAEWAGYIFMIARFWDAITDYLMGMISDNTSTRWGRRRPYILFGCVPFGIAFALLWLVPFEADTALFIYYVCITILFNTAFTVVSIPYNSMLPELSQNYDERTAISGYKMGFSFVGTLMAAAGIMLIVDVIFPGRGQYLESFPVMGVAFGMIIAVALLGTFAGTRERITHDEAFVSEGFFTTLKSIMALREFRLILGMFLFNMVGFDLIQVILIYFLKHVVQISEDYSFMIMAVPLVVAVIAAPVWVKIGEIMGKRRAYISAAFYMALVFLLCLIAPVGNLPFVLAIAGLAGIGISASQVIPFSIIPDVIEVDEYENGIRREGAFYGITMFLYKVASAVAVAAASGLLGIFGYIESVGGAEAAVQPDSAVMAIRIILGTGPGIAFLISAVFVKKLPITRERFDEIKRIVAERRGKRS